VRGFNQPGDFSAQSFSDMAATGANVVRVFVNMKLNASQNAYTFDLSDLDAAVSAGSADGFKVVIVFAPVTQLSVPEYWSSAALRASLQADWVATAAKYNGNATVAAYDLINEPSAPGGESQWQTFALQLISAIRNVDASHVIIFEPSPGGVPEAFNGLAPLEIANLVYSVHWYEPYGFTNQGLQTSVAVPYPSSTNSALGVVNKTTLSDRLAPVRQFAASSGAPVYVGEFSAVRWAPGGSANTYISDSIALFEAAGWSWNYHEWRGYPAWDAELPESWFAQFQMANALPQGWENANFGAARTDSTDTMTLLKGYFELNTH
jgi:aryl-phospho-beta-D-glucosidase BglC (GH1 family)